MHLFSTDLLKRHVEKSIEDYLRDKTIVIDGEYNSLGDFLVQDADTDMTFSEMANAIANDLNRNILSQMVYDYTPSPFTPPCKTCGFREGQWVSTSGSGIILENEVKGKHIIIPR